MATTAAAVSLEDRAFRFSAYEFASAWLAVAQAASKDEARPALSRTCLVEFYDEGVRLVATDGYIMLSAWVAQEGNEPPPDLDEAPFAKAIAIDPHGRGAGLMAHLRKLAVAAEKDGVETHVTIRVGEPPVDPTETTQFAGLEAKALIIDHPGREELALPLFEGEYPEWRAIFASHDPQPAKVILLNPEIIGRLAKLGKFYDEALLWTFGGTNGAALIELGPVYGAAMPMRWSVVEEMAKDDDADGDAA